MALTERLGAETVIEVTLRDGSPLIAALSRDAVYPLGSDMELTFNPTEAHVFAQADSPMKIAH